MALGWEEKEDAADIRLMPCNCWRLFLLSCVRIERHSAGEALTNGGTTVIPIAPSQADLYGSQRLIMQIHTYNTAFTIVRVMVASAVLAVVSNSAVVVLPTSHMRPGTALQCQNCRLCHTR